ncbi:MAG: polysaccharide biosynthesis protein [Rhodobacteraceae bacterium]|jgi:FlaA1/EpsC-like NDP-sugar epimerase|nr:polysaccharide biosynthesis protein [Paracoccaceae bacterium]
MGTGPAVLHKRIYRVAANLSRNQKRWILLAVDCLLVPLALVVTMALLNNGGAGMKLMPVSPAALLLLCAAAAVTSDMMGIPRIKLNAYEMRATRKTALFAAIVAAVLGVLDAAMAIALPAAAVILFGILFFLMVALSRLAMLHSLLWVYRVGQPTCRVLIYGAGTTGAQLAAALKSHESIEPVAFIDDNPALQSLTIAGLQVFPPTQIQQIVAERLVSRVLLAMPSASWPKQAEIVRRLQKMGLDVHALPSFAQLVGEEPLIDKFRPVAPGRVLGRDQLDAELPGTRAAYRGRVVLVSGAGGSIGSELCRQLLACKPRRLVLFEVSEIALYTLDMELRLHAGEGPTEIVAVLGSVTDSRMARAVMHSHGVEIVFHAAAYKHVPLVEDNPVAGMANNVLGTRTLADAAREAGVARFILISSDKAVRPRGIMGASKRLAEMVIQDMARRSQRTVFSIVRFGNVLGSSGSVIPLFQEQIARGGPVTVTHPEVTRYFMTISEACRLVLVVGSFSSGGEGGDPVSGTVFVLDMGRPVRIVDLARQMVHASGYSVRDEDHPDGDIAIEYIGLRRGEKLHEELLIGEGLLTTPHPKILHAREDCLSEIEVAAALRALRGAVASGEAAAAREVALVFVPGYAPSDAGAASGGGPARAAALPRVEETALRPGAAT